MESCLEIRVAKGKTRKGPGTFASRASRERRISDQAIHALNASLPRAPGVPRASVQQQQRMKQDMQQRYRTKLRLSNRNRSALVKGGRFAVSAWVGGSIEWRLQEIGHSLRMKNWWTMKCAARLRC